MAATPPPSVVPSPHTPPRGSGRHAWGAGPGGGGGGDLGVVLPQPPHPHVCSPRRRGRPTDWGPCHARAWSACGTGGDQVHTVRHLRVLMKWRAWSPPRARGGACDGTAIARRDGFAELPPSTPFSWRQIDSFHIRGQRSRNGDCSLRQRIAICLIYARTVLRRLPPTLPHKASDRCARECVGGRQKGREEGKETTNKESKKETTQIEQYRSRLSGRGGGGGVEGGYQGKRKKREG